MSSQKSAPPCSDSGRGESLAPVSSTMRRRLLLLELDPASPSPAPRITPTMLLPLPDSRAAVPLNDESPEEVLATLLASGLAIRASRVIEA